MNETHEKLDKVGNEILPHDWFVTKRILIEKISVLLEKGSSGIQEYCDSVKPLAERYANGERTQELYDLINSAKGGLPQ